MVTPGENPKKVDASDKRLRMLVALNACGYFDDETAIRVLQALNRTPEIDLQIESPRDMLNWLIVQGFVDAQSAEAVAEGFVKKLEAGEAPDGLITHASLVEEIDPRFGAPLAAFVERRRKKMKRMLLAYAAVIPLFIAVGIGFRHWLDSTPLCASASTKEALMRIGVKAMIERNGKMPDDAQRLTLTFANESEVGYDDSDKSRGCTAVARAGDKKSRMGYVIRPAKEGDSQFEVRTFPNEYVTARYSPAGLNPSLGAPLGRRAIHDALMKGVQGIDARVRAISPGYGKPSFGRDAPTTIEESVVDVIPAADCRATAAGRYACPVLIYYEDPLLEAVGAMPFVQSKGDFLFERDGSAWKVADGFDEAFLHTLATGRVGNVFGEDAMDATGAASAAKRTAR